LEMSSSSSQIQPGHRAPTPLELLTGIVDLVFPPVCLTCDTLGPVICDECLTKIVPLDGNEDPILGLDGIYSRGRHDGPLQRGVLRLKFGAKTALARPLARLCAEELRINTLPAWNLDALVPVPIHWTRRFGRGFNQSELLAEHLGRELAIPMIRPIHRIRPTGHQLGLSGAARRGNLRGAFATAARDQIKGRRLALVDDVCTTGTTLVECAEALRAAGAAAVFAITVSRG
jgi:competence protein ComFC